MAKKKEIRTCWNKGFRSKDYIVQHPKNEVPLVFMETIFSVYLRIWDFIFFSFEINFKNSFLQLIFQRHLALFREYSFVDGICVLFFSKNIQACTWSDWIQCGHADRNSYRQRAVRCAWFAQMAIWCKMNFSSSFIV